MFGIKNARRTAGQDEFVVRRRCKPGCSPLARRFGWVITTCSWATILSSFPAPDERLAGAAARLQKRVHLVGGDRDVCSFGHDVAFEMGLALVVGISEASGSDGNRSRFVGVIFRRDRRFEPGPSRRVLGRSRSNGNHGTVVAVEFDRLALRRHSHPATAGPLRYRERSPKCDARVMERAVTWMGLDEDEQRSVGLRLQVAVGDFDLAFGKCVSGSAIQPHGCAVVVMPPSLTRGEPVRTNIWSAGV